MTWNGMLQINPEPTVQSDPTTSLTPRERQVMSLIAEGLSNKDIAVRLRVAVHTVKSHVHNVLAKLGLRSRLEVAVLAHATSRIQRFAPSQQVA